MTEGLFWLLLKYFTVKLNNVKMLHMCPPNDKIVPTPVIQSLKYYEMSYLWLRKLILKCLTILHCSLMIC